MSQRILVVIAVLLAVLDIGLAVFWQPEPALRTVPKASQPAGGDFTLHSADGPVALQDFRGKLVLLYFGYTYCPDVCPTALTSVAEGLKLLKPEELARVAVLFVSVDPERDSPAHLKEYVAFFHPNMVGITGTPAEIAAVARPYGAFYAKQPAIGGRNYAVDHTSETYVLGTDGKLLNRLAHGTTPEQVAQEVRRRLP